MNQEFSLIGVVWGGGGAIALLVIMSIVVFAVLWERWNYFRTHFKVREEVMAGLDPFLNRRNYQECMEACDRNGSFLALIVRSGLKARADKRDVSQSMEREAKIQLLKLERRLPLLATIGSIAPFIGLFGTVLGIIHSFRDLSQANAGGAAVVSQGIAEALVATASGLFVAITAVFIYNWFQAKLNAMSQEAEIVISEMSERLDS